MILCVEKKYIILTWKSGWMGPKSWGMSRCPQTRRGYDSRNIRKKRIQEALHNFYAFIPARRVKHTSECELLIIVGSLARLYLTENLEFNEKDPTLPRFEERASPEERTTDSDGCFPRAEGGGPEAWLVGCLFWWAHAVLCPRATWWQNLAVYSEQCVRRLQGFNPERQRTWCRV